MNPLYHSTQNIPSTSGIYRITCMITGKFYIGSATNLYRRKEAHFATLRRNAHDNPKLQNAFNKHGEQTFTFEVLELVLIPELLTAREQYYFDKLKPFGKKGFNIATVAGSALGMKHSPETREKLRDKALGRMPTEQTRQKMSKAHTDRKHSLETKEKMSLIALGHTVSPEARAKIADARRGKPAHNRGKKISPESRQQMRIAHTREMKTFVVTSPDDTEQIITGMRAFCKENGLHHQALIRVAKGQQANHKGWKARYFDNV